MAHNVSYSTLTQAVSTVNHMLENGFGVVTVINARIYDCLNGKYPTTTKDAAGKTIYSDQAQEGAAVVDFKSMKADEIIKLYEGAHSICYLESLKTSTATVDGPTKSITGGQYANTLLKFGKTARLEMSDALGNGQALAAMTGAIIEDFDSKNATSFNEGRVIDQSINTEVLHFGSNFAGPKTIIGDTFFIDQKTGAQVKLNVIFYNVVPDSTFTLTMDAEGDATVFDMNGDLQTIDILVGTDGTSAGDIIMGNFYSIVPAVFTADHVEEEA